ncbi:hypothetical protein X975_17738, partial [Stegodyphus mimosarum]
MQNGLSDDTCISDWFYETMETMVAEEQEKSDPRSWNHCSGKDNPADLVNRGVQLSVCWKVIVGGVVHIG